MQRQAENEIWSVNSIFFKIHVENKIGRLVPDQFCFLKSSLWGKSKWVPPYFQYFFTFLDLDTHKKVNCKKFQIVDSSVKWTGLGRSIKVSR